MMVYENISDVTKESNISLSQACQALSIPKSSYYKYKNHMNNTKDLVEEEIIKVAEEYPYYGYRRITKTLEKNGNNVNHKKVYRIMKTKNILCKKKKKKIFTTNSNHGLIIYPNLTKDIYLTKLNELWVADITYIWIKYEFVYLASIMDRFSRKCVGWELDRHIDSNLVVKALTKAIENRKQLGFKGLIHHSDRGVQYASEQYISLLKESKIQISMSRKGNPYDNAYAESFFKTLKYEEVHMTEYESLEDAYTNIENFIEEVYNKKRLHSGIGYMAPEEYENNILKNTITLN